MNFKQLLLIGVISFLPVFAFSQNPGSVSGHVKSSTGEALIEAVIILEGTSFSTVTDSKGEFVLQDIPAGEYTIAISYIGHKTKNQKISIKEAEHVKLHPLVIEEEQAINEVTVTGKNETQKIKESAFSVSTIDAKPLHNSTADINQVLNRTTGVRIREDGGLGSNFNFSLNGFSGKQIKIFLDGIPMDNFGSSLTLNNIPINLADGIQVYKGVVPVWLGSDALGGAVNVVTNQKVRNYLDASYSYGSFNTHRSSINAGYTEKKTGLTVLTNLFQNYSDNNYWVNVEVPLNGFDGTLDPQIKRLRRFHDKYRSETAQVEIGVVNKKYADKLLAGVILSNNKQDIQTGAVVDRVYGQRYRTSKTLIGTLKYKKSDLFVKGLSLTLYGAYKTGENQTVDTSARTYNWYGNYIPKPEAISGEQSRTLYKFADNLALSNANLSYEINKTHSFNVNYSFNRFSRKGSDEVNPNNESYKHPMVLSKNIIGIAYKFDYKRRWETTLFYKKFFQGTQTSQRVDIYVNPHQETVRASMAKDGFGIATTYFVLPFLQVKGSYENTFRLPDSEEVFGDAVNRLSNYDLKPEQSSNVNVGLLMNKTFHEKHRIILEANVLYRYSENFIRYELSGPNSRATNQGNVETKGVDGEIRYSYKQLFHLGVNGTYQKLINMTERESGVAGISPVYKQQIPNIPFLFGNADAGVGFNNVGFKKTRLSFNWTLNYVQFYYLYWPGLGNKGDKNKIPQQISHNLSLTYSMNDGMFNVSFECRNIADSELYDNFLLPKPGRSFAVKLRYFISKTVSGGTGSNEN